MAWIAKDYGQVYHDERAGTFRYSDSGKTPAEEFPEDHFQCPLWAAILLDITRIAHGYAQKLVKRWDTTKGW